MAKTGNVLGVSDHGGWAVLVTVAPDGTLLDRRRVELVDENLPSIPHHHEAQMLSPDEGVALVERVRASAERYAAEALDGVASAVPDVRGIALRTCPPLPPSVAERITDYRARNVADWVMYRQALAAAAQARGWNVHWYDAKKLDLDAEVLQLRHVVGPPWNNDHRLAMAAAIAVRSSSIPEGWHSITPRLFCDDPARLVAFLKRAFDATGEFRKDEPSEIRIGDSIVMVSGTGPRSATRACFYLYVDDVDSTFRRALEAGGTSVEEPGEMPWGDRRGIVTDPFDNDWQIATQRA